MHLENFSEIVYNFTTSTAVVIGGVWAYFKFVRGRTFSHRAELSVAAAVEDCGDRVCLNVSIGLKNTGLSKLPLNDEMKYIQLYGMSDNDGSLPGSPEWKWLLTKKIFDQHAWIEAQETATDAAVFQLWAAGSQSLRHHAYQVEVWLGAPRSRITRKGSLWHGRTVAFTPVVSESQAILPVGRTTLFDRILNRRNGNHERIRGLDSKATKVQRGD
jgi:hypothetical protein